jgi:hypothetical protein
MDKIERNGVMSLPVREPSTGCEPHDIYNRLSGQGGVRLSDIMPAMMNACCEPQPDTLMLEQIPEALNG